MRFTQNRAIIAAAAAAAVAVAAVAAAAAVAVMGMAALSGAAPYETPDAPPENRSLEGILDAWRQQLLACSLASTPEKLAEFTAGSLSLMNATSLAVGSHAESPSAAHLIQQIAHYQTEAHLCMLDREEARTGVAAP